jgi:hypothetical protein
LEIGNLPQQYNDYSKGCFFLLSKIGLHNLWLCSKGKWSDLLSVNTLILSPKNPTSGLDSEKWLYFFFFFENGCLWNVRLTMSTKLGQKNYRIRKAYQRKAWMKFKLNIFDNTLLHLHYHLNRRQNAESNLFHIESFQINFYVILTECRESIIDSLFYACS